MKNAKPSFDDCISLNDYIASANLTWWGQPAIGALETLLLLLDQSAQPYTLYVSKGSVRQPVFKRALVEQFANQWRGNYGAIRRIEHAFKPGTRTLHGGALRPDLRTYATSLGVQKRQIQRRAVL